MKRIKRKHKISIHKIGRKVIENNSHILNYCAKIP